MKTMWRTLCPKETAQREKRTERKAAIATGLTQRHLLVFSPSSAVVCAFLQEDNSFQKQLFAWTITLPHEKQHVKLEGDLNQQQQRRHRNEHVDPNRHICKGDLGSKKKNPEHRKLIDIEKTTNTWSTYAVQTYDVAAKWETKKIDEWGERQNKKKKKLTSKKKKRKKGVSNAQQHQKQSF